MTYDLAIRNALLVSGGEISEKNLVIKDGLIYSLQSTNKLSFAHKVIDAKGEFLIPGAIDDQVHFREPGLIHKATIASESRAAVAGGITSFMEMPNTSPPALTVELLEDKYTIASKCSLANYSFYMGTSNNNLDEILKIDARNVCGLKIFLGSSTGNLVVDRAQAIEDVFKNVEMLIAVHCEDDDMIREKSQAYIKEYGQRLDASFHPLIRDREACYKSSAMAVQLAKKYGTRLHVLHISTKEELSLFSNTLPLAQKRITAEACIHHLFFNDEDYKTKGNWIKWNPAVKAETDRQAIFNAVLNDTIDVIATDHAPHTIEEKQKHYLDAPSGGPLVQHALPAMLEFWKDGKISIEKIVDKMCHKPAELFNVDRRGFLTEGYWADMVLLNTRKNWKVTKDNLLYKCGWSPFEQYTFRNSVDTTIVNGNIAYTNGSIVETSLGKRLLFNR